MELTREQIVAMAVAAIAEETGAAPETVRVTAFREVCAGPLARYLSETGKSYHKYQLEDESRG